MKNFKVWLVEAKKQKVYLFFKGKKQITANDMNDLARFCKKLQQENPNDCWAICTNECATSFQFLGVNFINGKFMSL